MENGEWEEMVNFIEKKREDEESDESQTEGQKRALFMKSFHPFGQSYPLKRFL